MKCAELARDVIGEDNTATAHVIDFGCGTGLVGKYLHENFGFRTIVGIDGSAGMI